MRIAVLGAGAAGLCAGRHATSMEGISSLVIYEQTSNVGGTWVYTDRVGVDDWGLPIHSSMYRDMRTNLPVETMQFPDFEFPIPLHETASFVSHRSVHNYLEEYAQHFQLKQFIRFSTHVKRVSRSLDGMEWQIQSEHLDTNQCATDVFDAVFVCTGHYSVPKQLDVSPYQPKHLIHSHDYRQRDHYAGLTVACLGSGPSGIDISLELSTVCSTVYLCHNNSPIMAPLPGNVLQKPGFSKYLTHSIELLNGELITPDVVILCTGYEYSYPFLDKNSIKLTIEDDRCTPLYQHMVCINDPTIFFIGLANRILPFPVFHVQIMFALRMLQGMFLVSKDSMLEWERNDYAERTIVQNMPHRKAHFMGAKQWEYCQQLCQIAGFRNPIKRVVCALYTATHNRRLTDVAQYKNMRFEVIDDETFNEV